jgi:hypothetical protein
MIVGPSAVTEASGGTSSKKFSAVSHTVSTAKSK